MMMMRRVGLINARDECVRIGDKAPDVRRQMVLRDVVNGGGLEHLA
jgi:hypothetical protein